MRNQPIELIGEFYADNARPWSQQDVCNWLPCAAESPGTRTMTMCKTPPGLSPFLEVSSTARPVRGVYSAEGRLFAAMGDTLYLNTTSAVAIPLGTIPGVGRVRMSNNQITGGNEVIAVNGSSGYVYNTVTTVFQRITDAGYPGAIDVVFIDGYLIQIEPARRFAFHSDLADALSYNTLDRFTSEVSPDLLVGLGVRNNELILLSETTGEFFENTGATQQPFRSKRISFDKGCAGRYTIVTLDNTVAWLGNDGMFYMLDGYSPRRISNRPIEQAIRGLNWTQAFAFTWETEGHSVVYWTFPDGRTWGYDFAQRKWHRRESYGLNRWRVSDTTFWNRTWIAGDFQYGRLWELDLDYPWEGDQEFVSEIVGPVLHDHQNSVLMPYFEVLMDVGQPEVDVRTFPTQPDGPTITGSAPDGNVGAVYGPFTYTVTPGDASIVSVTLRSGAFPDGVTMDNDGELTGTPTEAGTFTVTVRVTDANGLWGEHTDTLEIVALIPLYVGVGSQLDLQVSVDGGLTFGDTADTGVINSATNSVGAADGFLYHWSTGSSTVYTTDGTTFDPVTGISSGGDFIIALKTATEWQLYKQSSSNNMDYSTDGVAFTNRTITNGVMCPVQKGTTILGIANVSGGIVNQFIRSTNEGLSWEAAYAESGFKATSGGLQRLVLAANGDYLAFGLDGSSLMAIGRSSTGASGSWTVGAGPVTTPHAVGVCVATTGRILMIVSTGAAWYSDNHGTSWTLGTAVTLGSPPLASATAKLSNNNLYYSNDAFFFIAPQGGGVNRIYRSTDGVAAWSLVYTSPASASINSMVEFQP